jgi:hypothetical protein
VSDPSVPLPRAADRLRALPPVAVDALIAVLCYLATVAAPMKAAAAQWWLFALATLASLPLVWRRRHPIVVTAIVGAGTIGLALTGGSRHPLPGACPPPPDRGRRHDRDRQRRTGAVP